MKPRSWAVFIGVATLLAITFVVGRTGPTLAGAAARDTSVTVSQGTGSAAGPAGSALVSAARPGPPKRIGHGPGLPHGARRLGALAAATKINVDVVLASGNAAALQDYAANVSSPGNALYHHYLTVSQFASTFGPSASAIAAVEASLRADGLKPGTLSANHLVLPVTATAKQFGGAFSIGFDQYQLSGGRVAYANTAAPLFPGAAAQYVSTVVGLDSLATIQPIGPPRAVKSLATASPQVVTGGPQPCATIAGASNSGIWTADSLASAYNFSSLYQANDEGAGVTVALVEFGPNLTSDITQYQSCYGTNATVSYSSVDGGSGSGPGNNPEATADIEDVIGLAPKATIDVFQAPAPDPVTGLISQTEVIDEYNAVVQSHAQVISTSWASVSRQTAR